MRRLISLLSVTAAAALLVAGPLGSRASAAPAPSPTLATGAAGWGYDAYNTATGQGYSLPLAVRASRGAVPADAEITKIFNGHSHGCLIADGRAYCWGSRALGRSAAIFDEVPFPVAVDTTGVLAGKTIVDLALAMNVTCALADDSTLACWGANYNGELGTGNLDNSGTPVAVDTSGVLNGKTIVDIAAARSSLCALDNAGQAYCWGSNIDGTVGNDSGTDTAVPVAVDQRNLAGTGFASISDGDDSLCGLSTLGAVYCWGQAYRGQVGDNLPVGVRRVPSAVTQNAALGSDAVAVFGGKGYNCALRSNGQAACWGGNNYGELGTGSAGADSPVPVAVASFPGRDGRPITDIAPGEGSTCVLVAGEDTFCWGSGGSGSTGQGNYDDILVPTQIVDSPQGLDGVTLTSLASLTGAICGLGDDGEMYCWGNSSSGSTATGASENTKYPTPVLGIGLNAGETWEQFAAGYEFSCGRTSLKRVFCWGYGGYGGLGNETGDDSFIPLLVAGDLADKSVIDIAAGMYHVCALTDASAVYCWGSGGTGALGNGDTSDQFAPVLADTASVVPSGRTIADITSGYESSCILDSAGAIYCWGSNSYGQLGVGDFDDRDIPTPVTPPTGIVFAAVDSDFYETCALDTAGNAYCWGRNDWGSIGNGVDGSDSYPTPLAVVMDPLSGGTFDAIDVGESQVCALSSGAIWCWGNNGSGQLGNGTTDNSAVPTPVDTSGVLAGKTVVDVSVGAYITCAVDSDGGAYCWGSNDNGMNANGTSDTDLVPTAVVQAGTLLAGSKFAKVTIGGETPVIHALLQPQNRVPDAPGLLSASARPNGRALISWTSPTGGGVSITDYVVQVSTAPNGPWTSPASCDAVSTATSCVARGLSESATYYVRVAAVNDNGQGPWARTKLARTPSIVIEGRRANKPAFIRVSGDAVGLMRHSVVVHVKRAGQDVYRSFSAGRVDAAGRFTWAGRVPERSRVYVTIHGVRSNNVDIPGRR